MCVYRHAPNVYPIPKPYLILVLYNIKPSYTHIFNLTKMSILHHPRHGSLDNHASSPPSSSSSTPSRAPATHERTPQTTHTQPTLSLLVPHFPPTTARPNCLVAKAFPSSSFDDCPHRLARRAVRTTTAQPRESTPPRPHQSSVAQATRTVSDASFLRAQISTGTWLCSRPE